jgi:hypothetical protein
MTQDTDLRDRERRSTISAYRATSHYAWAAAAVWFAYLTVLRVAVIPGALLTAAFTVIAIRNARREDAVRPP